MLQQLPVKVLVRDGFKTKAKLAGMERQGIISHHSTLRNLENQMGKLQAAYEKAQKAFEDDFKDLAEKHGLDPNIPSSQYELNKKLLSLRDEFIPSNHKDQAEPEIDSSEPGVEESDGDTENAQRRSD